MRGEGCGMRVAGFWVRLVVEELPQRQQGALALAVLVRGILPELVVLVRGRGVVRVCGVRGVARACGKGGGTGVC